MKVCFKTFGCRLNKAEALQMEAEHLADGWQLAEDPAAADRIVVRGCSVTAKAQHDCEKLITQLRRKHPQAEVIVCGCLPGAQTPPPRLPDPDPVPIPTRTARAYLKLQDGCAGKCSFCIVPRFRGTSRSVPFSGVLDQAKRFLENGYHELVLTGCNLSLYASEGKRLPELIDALANLPPAATGPFRIRLGSLEPGDCALETVTVMSEHPNLCRFLHIPVQSGSNRILSAMRRPYRIEDVSNLLEIASRKLPWTGLGCDLMTGFPGETDEDFAETLKLLRGHSFSNAHVFPYSERPGTDAATMQPAIAMNLRAERAEALSRIASAQRQAFAAAMIGRACEVLIENEAEATGWTGEYLPARVQFAEGTRRPHRKELVTATVVAADGDQIICASTPSFPPPAARD